MSPSQGEGSGFDSHRPLRMKVSCLIPFFNEQERIGKVLEQISKVASIDEIICIDDGSTDGTASFIHHQFPQINVIRNANNVGKTAAVKKGLEQARGEYILLFDADLRDVYASQVERAVKKTLKKNADMVILRHMYALWTMNIVRGDILVSGERILKKKDLQKVLSGNVKKFQLEFAMNQYMLDNRKSVFWMPSSARNTYKFKKNGFFKGWYEMIAVAVNILWYIGLRNYVKQILFFCKEELR